MLLLLGTSWSKGLGPPPEAEAAAEAIDTAFIASDRLLSALRLCVWGAIRPNFVSIFASPSQSIDVDAEMDVEDEDAMLLASMDGL